MVVHYCKVCEYLTKYKNDYTRHMNSKKHHNKVLEVVNTDSETVNTHSQNSSELLETPEIVPHKSINDDTLNEIKTYKCKSCGNTFVRQNNLTRHYKICALGNNEIVELKKQLKISLEQTKHYKHLFEEAGSVVKKSIGAVSYIMNNYKSAPALKTITIDDFNENIPKKDKVAEHILSAYKNKTLSKYIGNVIIKVYKKDNPKQQSIWNTDDNRLSYMLKEIIENKTKSSNWIVDKKGTKTAKYIVKPLLDHIRALLEEYNLSINPADYKYDASGMQLLLENSRALLKLANDIDTGITSTEVLKYISAHLRFNKKNK